MQIKFKSIVSYCNKFVYSTKLVSIKPIIETIEDDVKERQNIFNDIKKLVKQFLVDGSMELNWFCKHCLKSKTDIYNFINKTGDDYQIIELLSKYSKLSIDNKKKFPLDNTVDLKNLKQFMFKFEKKHQNKDKKFKAPLNAELIKIPNVSNYKVYKCYVNNKLIQDELNRITYLGKNNLGKDVYYTSWCVINKTHDWGYLTSSQFPYYYYITSNDNKPIILMNFGDDGEINDIHDRTFTKWNDELLSIVHYLMYIDNYNPKDKDNNIFNTKYNQLDYMEKIRNGMIDVQKLKKIDQKGIYQLYEDQKNEKFVIVKNNQIVYFFYDFDIHKIGNEKLNKNIIDLLIDNNFIKICSILLADKIIQPQNATIFNKCLQFVCKDINYFMALVNKDNIIQKYSQFFNDKVNELLDGKTTYSKQKTKRIIQKLNISQDKFYLFPNITQFISK